MVNSSLGFNYLVPRSRTLPICFKIPTGRQLQLGVFKYRPRILLSELITSMEDRGKTATEGAGWESRNIMTETVGICSKDLLKKGILARKGVGEAG